MTQTLCDCGSTKPYHECCGPLISGKAKAVSPEELMRSRYTAFCKKKSQYLMETRHPDNRYPNDLEAIRQTMERTQWLGLKILKYDKNRVPGKDGAVEFVAFYKTDDVGQLHERSHFVMEGDTWYYQEGQLLEPVKLQRNEPCFCGSGKKYKKCHG